MIDYKNNFIFNLLNEKALKAFSHCTSFAFYDKRIKTVFRKILIAPRPLHKYYFSDTTMERIKSIDLTNCHPTKLGYLFEKHGAEVGICICKEDNLAFVYIIGAVDIQLIITSGTSKSSQLTVDNYRNENYAGFDKTIVGSCIISYDTDIPSIMANNIVAMIQYKKQLGLNISHKEIKRLDNEFKYAKKIGLNLGDIDNITLKNNLPYYYNKREDLTIKNKKIWTAIQMFIFLKTAKVIDKTFISENQMYGKLSKSKLNVTNGITIIDSTWDSSINVINPFAVRGHFRDQPKKNKKKEWYYEVIYIDSFMKTGYHRRATIELANN